MLIKSKTLTGILLELADPEKAKRRQPVVDIVDEVAVAEQAATSNPGLNPLGRRMAVSDALLKARSGLQQYEAEAQSWRARAEATRAEAVASWFGEVDRADAREIRDLIRSAKADPETAKRIGLAGTDPAALDLALHAAVQRGDKAFVTAVMDAPGAFPMVTPSGVERARELILEGSPLLGRYTAEQEEAGAVSGLVTAARQDIGKVAIRHGLGPEWQAMKGEQ